MQTVQGYLTPLQNALRNPSSLTSRVTSQANQAASQASSAAQSAAQTAANQPQQFLSQLRNFDSAALTSVGVVAAEVLGFFTIGEIIGRFKLVGYRGEHGHHE
jgi:F-type H+-transporting ATPase subunit g